MNKQIRSWIQRNRQPWRWSSKLSGPVLNDYSREYFEKRGETIDSKLPEELLENELMQVYDLVISRLPILEREKVDSSVAIGYSSTFEPNACCLKCLDGYAILFDSALDALLISSTEQCLALLYEPKQISSQEFPAIINNTVLSIFFAVCEFKEPIDVNNFVHREIVNREIWLTTIFLISHEIGHMVLRHNEGGITRRSALNQLPYKDIGDVIDRRKEQEYDADVYAMDFLLQNQSLLFVSSSDLVLAWSAAYVTLGRLFSVLALVEELSLRVNLPLADTHPSALSRWEKISHIMKQNLNIKNNFIALDNHVRSLFIDSGKVGPLPEQDDNLMARIYRLRNFFQGINI